MREPAGKCDVCGLSGSPEASMSITEAGNTCQACYFKWEQAQRQQMLEAEREASRAAHSSYRWRALAAVVIAIVLIVVSNWSRCGATPSP
jgi:hypothetical protein